MKKSFVALAVVFLSLSLFAGLTARAEMKVGSFKSLQSAEKAMVGKKDKVFYPSKDGQSLADAMRQSPGMSLTEARAFDKNHEDQSYLVMWEESGTGSGGSGKKTITEEKVRYVEKPAPAPAPVPKPEVIQDRRPSERRGFLGGIGQLLGSIISISIQPTLSVEYGGNSGQYYVPDYVPTRRYYYQEQSYRTYCPPRYPTYRSNRNYCPPRSNGGRNTNVVNNEVRVQVERQGSSTRTSSGPTFARGDTTRDPSGPTRSSSGSSSHHR